MSEMTLRERYQRNNRLSFAIEDSVIFLIIGIGIGFGVMMAWAVITACVAAIV